MVYVCDEVLKDTSKVMPWSKSNGASLSPKACLTASAVVSASFSVMNFTCKVSPCLMYFFLKGKSSPESVLHLNEYCVHCHDVELPSS